MKKTSKTNQKAEYRTPKVRELGSLNLVQDTYISGYYDGGYNIRE